ncbi:MAG: sugar transporter, partial [Coleofasciculaceae cyanobacterium SM2_3_26]|nr:sugar transporter [Coleofasciculaceae cyanobacterium SM2_3_26]
DRIRIEIVQVPQYSGEHEVLVNGTLNLPLLGSVTVEGLTLEQVASTVASLYESARILRRPRVTVSLLAPRQLQIGVAGEVRRPGSYTVAPQGLQFPTVTQILTLAGGITQAADLSQVQVLRPRSDGTEEAIAVDLQALLETGSLQPDLTLRDGDTIFVPTAPSIVPAAGAQIATASFAGDQAQPINIAILGEVRRPGTHTVTGEGGQGGIPTVTQALQVAGGITSLADIRRVQVRRSTRSGVTQTIELDLMQVLQQADLSQDLLLQDGDTIVVPTASEIDLAAIAQLRFASFAPEQSQPINVAVLGEVNRPGAYVVSGRGGVGGEPTLTQALLAAGGITQLANIRQIQILRQSSMGEILTVEVNLWELLQTGDATQDVVLQEGDAISVPTAIALDPKEASELAAASFSPETIRVNIVGEVRRAGVQNLPPNTPLDQAILAAGGFNPRARRRSVELIRLNPDGTVSQRKISIDLARGVSEESNPPLRNNDVIIVKRSLFASVADVLSVTITPIDRVLTILTLPSRLRSIVDDLSTREESDN